MLDIAQIDLLSVDRLTSHRYIPPMDPSSTSVGITTFPTAAAANTSSITPYSAPAKPRIDLLATKTQRLRHAHAINIRHESAQKSQKCCAPIVLTPKASPETTIGTPAESTKQAVKPVGDGEAPVPGFFSAREHFYSELASMVRDRPVLLRSADQEFPVPGTTFTICCNHCDMAIPDAHWHCSICDDGDFDLCAECVEQGVLCDAANHWLIKRFVQNGKVINSTTERIAPVKVTKSEPEKEVPGAFAAPDKKEEQVSESVEESRTCNSCVGGKALINTFLSDAVNLCKVFSETNFVTCTVCDDYDLCIPCHVSMKHGHHPGHALEPASKKTILDTMALNLCAPGRNMRHFAICDGCDKVCSVIAVSFPVNCLKYLMKI